MPDGDGEWFEEAAFWERFAPVMFGEERWAEVPAVVDGLARLSGIAPGPGPESRVLDLCCGMGRISLELAGRGYAVTGVDLTASYLDAARESAAADGVELELVLRDVRRFSRPASFGLSLNLYTSFGYFDDPADDALLAQVARESLVPGGAFVIETLGKELAVRDFTEGEWFDRGGYTVLTEFSVVDSWAALRNRWITIRGADRFERSFDQRLYAGTELRALLLGAGFSSVDLYGDWNGSPYDQKARVLIAIGRA